MTLVTFINGEQLILESGIYYSINSDGNTVSVVGSKKDLSKIFVPQKIIFEKKEYIITCLCYLNNEIIQFAENSLIQKFGVNSFYDSKIEKLTIPNHVTEICENAFEFCEKLQYVEFLPDSELQIIGKNAFTASSIQSIIIPQNVYQINEGTFSHCKQLKFIGFTKNSKLKKIKKNAFYDSSISCISLPSGIIELEDDWCAGVLELNDIKIIEQPESNIMYYDNKYIISKSDPLNNDYDVIKFARRDIEEAIIPSNIRKICNNAFSFCKRLKKVEFFNDSKLAKIEKKAFYNSSISCISLPSGIAELEEGWCAGTSELKEIKIIEQQESNIIYYDDKFIICKSDPLNNEYDAITFARRDIKNVKIPKFIKQINSNSFQNTKITNITIPSNVIKIGENAFSFCKYLKNFAFDDNTELNKIEKSTFAFSSIYKIIILAKITSISYDAFFKCKNLRNIELSSNSKLHEINWNFRFADSIYIPSSVNKIEIFFYCSEMNLQIIEFDENINKNLIKRKYFLNAKIVMIPFGMEIYTD